MTHNPQTIQHDALAINAVARMQEKKITSMPVIRNQNITGIVTMHALLAAGVM